MTIKCLSTYHFKWALPFCVSIFLSGCLSGVWTGANLFYDRHNVFHSLSDYELDTRAHRTLFQGDALECTECHIDVAVFNGDILLAGHVETAEIREEAYKRLAAQQGYRHLYNKISIEPFKTNLLKDSWITAKIRSQIIADSEIDPHAFKIVTSDQVVYLMGDVIPNQAKWVVDIASTTAGVKRVVKLLNYYHLMGKVESVDHSN
jgi:osmotically-inducible protein OsmY